ncbi:MAG TPA: hypothetical protein VFI79_19395 [Gemmatimonadales bacterium]|nr:hypothetical protein [Gemmatimonadales bacterium]
MLTTATSRWDVLTWRDSSWMTSCVSDFRASYLPAPVITPGSDHYLLWIGTPTYDTGSDWLLLSKAGPFGFTEPETIMTALGQDSEYGVAVYGDRRWAVRVQQRFPASTTFAVYTAVSDTPGVWRMLPERGVDEFMCSIAPLDPNRAMVAYSGQSGLAWGVIEGRNWAQEGVLDNRPWATLHPRLRLRPSGGVWLAWTEESSIHVAHYADGVWTRDASVSASHPDGQTFISGWCEASRDTAEEPVLVWGDLGYGYTYRDVGCVAFPVRGGWSQGEEIPGSDGLYTSPSATRDRFGDVWTAWRRLHGYVFGAHTYTKATASNPQIANDRGSVSLTWTLSEPAPGSHWTVLRTYAGASEMPIGDIIPDSGLVLSWRDPSPPKDRVSYRLRRESLDSRCLWYGPAASWPPLHASRLQVSSACLTASEGILSLAVEGAARGQATLNIYDLQGRRVASCRVALDSGASRVGVSLPDSVLGMRSGVLFMALIDAGTSCAVAKVVILR